MVEEAGFESRKTARWDIDKNKEVKYLESFCVVKVSEKRRLRYWLCFVVDRREMNISGFAAMTGE